MTLIIPQLNPMTVYNSLNNSVKNFLICHGVDLSFKALSFVHLNFQNK